MPKVLILYDTRTGNTGRMAHAVAEGARSVGGVEVALKKVGGSLEELAAADGIILGSPTHNTRPSQAMRRLLSNLGTIPLGGKVGAAFGSYGWSGEAPRIIARALRDRGLRVVGEAVRVRKTPNANDLARCRDLGRAVAEALSPIEEEKGG